MTRLIGRERDLTTLQNLVRDGDTRLITLIGPPGAGKTRLALALAEASADAFPDGVQLVPLAPLSGPELVAGAIARAFTVVEPHDKPLIASLSEHLRSKALLLVLDNFEHVLAARSVIATLLAACPRLTVLLTSQVPTRLDAERLVPVPPLRIPDLEQPLTRRECEVVTLIAQGLSNRQIADQLGLSLRTVERHIENIHCRLGIVGKAGRAIVTAYAFRHGLIENR